MSFSRIRPSAHVALRLPSGAVKVVEVAPNTYVWEIQDPLLYILCITNDPRESYRLANMDALQPISSSAVPITSPLKSSTESPTRSIPASASSLRQNSMLKHSRKRAQLLPKDGFSMVEMASCTN